MAKIHRFSVELEVLSLNEVELTNITLLEDTRKIAALSAYAPYSNFKVGAGVLLSNGQIILGSNQENMAYPSGLCAERVAIFSAMSQVPQEEIMAIAIHSPSYLDKNKFVPPCGACRQVMAELEHKQKAHKKIPVYMIAINQEIYKVSSVEVLLPFPFIF